jgi:hypothetical protein
MAEIGRLGEDLDVEERRRRLQRDLGQLLEPVQAAGGMDVAQRDREDQAAGPGRQPTRPTCPALRGPAADDVVAVVDRLEQGLQMGLGPRLLGRRHQDEREVGAGQADGQGGVEPSAGDRHDPGLDRAVHRAQRLDQRCDDGLGAVGGQVGEQDDADPGVGQRVAAKVATVGVVEFLGHFSSM